MKNSIYLMMLALFSMSTLHAQIVINEVNTFTDEVELLNLGSEEVDISSYIFCTFPVYTDLNLATIVSGDLSLSPGEFVVLGGHTVGDDDGELALYTASPFGNSDNIIDYLEWGSSGHPRASVAMAAGIWVMSDFVDAPPVGESLMYDGDGNGSANWFSGAPTLGAMNVEGGDCEAEGGEISTTDPTTICAGDGIGDPINVELEGAEGTNSQWVITNEAGDILGLPEGNGPFDLEGAGEGICLIWHLSFEDGLTGAIEGNNASDLEGCFDLSNPITVNRNGVDGGEISTMDPTTICAGDGIGDPINVELEGAEGTNSQWVITNEAGDILGLPEGNGPFDLEGAGEGICLIWHLSFEDGLTGAIEGNNASDLEGCFDLSNPITVNRNGVDGGEISTTDPTTICAGDGIGDPINVELEGAEGTNSQWVITNEAGDILGLPEGDGPFDLEGAGEGICLIWHLSFEDGLTGAIEGNNASDLEGCFNLSNPITVTRLVGEDCDCLANGGIITTEDSTNICVGDGQSDPINVELEGAEGTNSQWVITNEAGDILDLPEGNGPFDLEGAGEGICLIWHLSFEEGLTGAIEGNNASDLEGCFDLSNPITVIRTEIDGGILSTSALDNVFTICAGDGIQDPIDVTLEGNMGSNSQWVITDPDGVILGLPESGPFDLEDAGGGQCLIWHLSYEDGIVGLAVDADADDLEGCFHLSNPVTVNRVEIAGGMVSTADGETFITVEVGDGIADVVEFEVVDDIGINYAWIITDDQDNILGFPPGNSNDFEDANGGICRVYGIAYIGDLETENAIDLDDVEATECYDISDNYIEVTRLEISSVEKVDFNTINVYPNPANASIRFDLPFDGVTNYLIYSIDGREVRKGQLNQSFLDINSLEKGIYQLQLSDVEGNHYLSRFLKE